MKFMVYGPSVVLATSGCCCDRLLDLYMCSNNIYCCFTESVMDGDHVYACVIHKWHWGSASLCVSVSVPISAVPKVGMEACCQVCGRLDTTSSSTRLHPILRLKLRLLLPIDSIIVIRNLFHYWYTAVHC